MQHFQQKRIVSGLLIGLAGALLLLGRPATISRAQGPCGPGQIDMLDYMLPTDQSSGNQMSNGECFYTYEDRPGHFYIVKSCSNGIWLEEYYYDNNGIYLGGDTTWTDQCPDGSYASAIHTGGAGQPGALRYPRCVSDPGAGATTSIAPASGSVSGLSKDTCNPCNTVHSGPYTFPQTLTNNGDGTITVTNVPAGESYTYDPQYGWTGFDGPTGSADRTGDWSAVEPDPALLDCLAPSRPPGLCVLIPAEMKECCPIKSAGAEGWVVDLFKKFGTTVISILRALIPGFDISFTLHTIPENILTRSTKPVQDADYWWAAPEARYDPRRISLPEEEPEENGMWGGVAMRLAPPNYRPPAMWKPHRDQRREWRIALDQYNVVDWVGDDGDAGVPSALHPEAKGTEDAWRWLINTPGVEERVLGYKLPSLSLAMSPSAGTNQPSSGENSSYTSNVSETSSYEGSASSSQTLGVQLAQPPEYCMSVEVSCSITNWEATCSVSGDCKNCGHNHIESVPKVVYGTECAHPGPACPGGAGGPCSYSIPHDQNTFSVTFINKGDSAACQNGGAARATCQTTLDANGNGGCSASSGNVCGTTAPGEVGLCHPPYMWSTEQVCSDLSARPIPDGAGLQLIFDRYLGGGVELNPIWPLLEWISFFATGVPGDKYEDYKKLREAGVGGVLDLFLPPDGSPPEQQKFPTRDVNADYGPHLKVDIHWGCPNVLGLGYTEKSTYKCCKGGDCYGIPGCYAPSNPCGGQCDTSDCDYSCCKEGAGCWGVDSCKDCLLEETCKKRNCRECVEVARDCCLTGTCPPKPKPICIPSGISPDLPLTTEEGTYLIDRIGTPPWALENVVHRWLAPPE